MTDGQLAWDWNLVCLGSRAKLSETWLDNG